jgi:hypothetical protein
MIAAFWIDVAPWICVGFMVAVPLLFIAALARAVYEVERDRRDEQIGPIVQRAPLVQPGVANLDLERARRRMGGTA